MTAELTALFAVFLMLMGLIAFGLSVADRVVRRGKESDGRIPRASILEALGLLLGAVGLTILCVLLMASGWFWILQVPLQLAVGWLSYLMRVTDQVKPDPWSVASAVVCVVAAVFGTHVFLRWLASTASREWPMKRTLQVLLFVVMMFVVGLAFTGLVQQTGWLIRTPDSLVKDNRKIS